METTTGMSILENRFLSLIFLSQSLPFKTSIPKRLSVHVCLKRCNHLQIIYWKSFMLKCCLYTFATFFFHVWDTKKKKRFKSIAVHFSSLSFSLANWSTASTWHNPLWSFKASKSHHSSVLQLNVLKIITATNTKTKKNQRNWCMLYIFIQITWTLTAHRTCWNL